MPKNKEMKLTILGVVFLLILIIGASYSYFSIVNSENGSTTTTLNGVTESLDNYGTAAIKQQIDKLHINLGLSDLAPGNIGTSYYATEDENAKYNKEQSNHKLSLIEIANGNETDLLYTCTSEIIVKVDGISNEEINTGDGKLYLGNTSETIGNEAVINPKEIDFKDIVLESEGYKIPVKYYIIGNSNIYITGDFKIENRAADQNALAGKSINIDISNHNLSCSVEKVNVLPPGEFNFYVQNNIDENKYTNTEEVDVYLSWTDEDVDSYCVTEGTIDDCVWKKTEGKSATGKYTIQDNTTGEKKIKAYLKDKAENVSKVHEDIIIIDKEDPTIETLTIKESYTNTNEVSVELVASDNYELSEYCLTTEENIEGCTWKAITDEIKANILGEDGSKKLYGYVKDKAGNVSKVKESTEVLLDTESPSVSTVTLKGTALTDEFATKYTSSTNVEVTLDYNDTGSGVYQYCTLVTTEETAPEAASGCTDKWTNITDSYTATLAITNGTKYFHVYVKDKAGNISLVKSNSIMLDTENPSVSSVTLTGTNSIESLKNTFTSSAVITIGLGYNDSGSGVHEYCLMSSNTTEGCDWDVAATSVSYTLTGEGTNDVYAFVRDKVGNVSAYTSGTTNKSITLDTTAPVLTDTNYTVTSSSSTNVTATIGIVTETNPYQYCFRNGTDGDFECGDSKTKEYTATPGTPYTIYAYVIDKVGKLSSTVSKSVTPQLPFFTPLELVAQKPQYLSESLVGDMYRYQGLFPDGDSSTMPNWICFGTKDQEVCKEEYDKYMYRIIGITQEGQLYLLKETFLKEGTVTGFAWNDEYLIDSSSLDGCFEDKCPEWNDADLFHRINGTANGTRTGKGDNDDRKDNDTDIFVDSTYYDYLKSGDNINGGTEASEWYNLIDNHSWYYGENTLTSRENFYSIETGKSYASHTVKSESGTIKDELYFWNKKVDAKISLMYLHDVYYVDPKGATIKNSWMDFKKDSFNTSQDYEWLSVGYGIVNAYRVSDGAYHVQYSSNYIVHDSLVQGHGVRPVFYISSNIVLTGAGTKDSPFVLK